MLLPFCPKLNGTRQVAVATIERGHYCAEQQPTTTTNSLWLHCQGKTEGLAICYILLQYSKEITTQAMKSTRRFKLTCLFMSGVVLFTVIPSRNFSPNGYIPDVFSSGSMNRILSTSVHDQKSPEELTSLVSCDHDNCALQNVCVEFPPKQLPQIRFVGNKSYVQHIMGIVKNATSISYRDRNSFALGTMESNFSFTTAPNATGAATNRFVSRNCGHDLGDEAWPLHRLMRLFDEPNPILDDMYFVSKQPRYCDQVLDPIAKRRIVSESGLQCYARFYVGTRGMSYMADHGTWPHRKDTLVADMRAFRSRYHNFANVPSEQNTDTIVIMEKTEGTHMCNIGNRHEIANYLRQAYPDYQVKLVSWPNYTIKEQINLMSRTKLMISLPGSDVMNAVFLPDDGALLMFCRREGYTKDGKHRLDKSRETDSWFQYLPYMKLHTEPCDSSAVSYTPEEYSDTIVDLSSLQHMLEKLGMPRGAAPVSGTQKTISATSKFDPTVVRRQPHPFTISLKEKKEVCAPNGEGPEGNTAVHDFLSNSLQVQTATADPPSIKLFCAVYTHPGGEPLLEAQRQTWAPRCDGYLAASSYTDENKGIVDIPHTSKYLHQYKGVWRKVRAMYSYIYQNFGEDYDYFHFNGDDVYLVVENLKLFLRETKPKFVGIWFPMVMPRHKFMAMHNVSLDGMPNDFYYVGGGPGYTLSRDTLKTLVEDILPHCHHETDSAPEDVFVSHCLWKAGIKAEPQWDTSGAHRYHHLSLWFLQFYDISVCGHRLDCNYWKKTQRLLSKYGFPQFEGGGLTRFASNSSTSFHGIKTPAYMKRVERLVYRRGAQSDCE